MLLSEIDLQAEVSAGRLRFEPKLARDRFQSASIDLSLHDEFWRSAVPAGEGIDTTIDIAAADPYQYREMEKTDILQLAPGDLVLGATAEAITMPQHLAGWIEGKSGRARHGLIIHCTAPHVAPGWGRQKPKRVTLEMVNHSELTLKLRAGTPIAQLLVERLTSPTQAPYSGSHAEKGA